MIVTGAGDSSGGEVSDQILDLHSLEDKANQVLLMSWV